MSKLNCWEFKQCSDNSMNLHKGSVVCPAKKEFIADGLNGGINGGRMCWTIMETHCKQKADRDCFQCEFRYKVISEEGLINSCNAIGIYLSRLNSHNSPVIDQIA